MKVTNGYLAILGGKQGNLLPEINVDLGQNH